jgi:hypothetical protein
MKCDDINYLLDKRALTELAVAETAEVEAHVAACRECARLWSVSERLAQFRCDVPPLPASLRERARRLHAACESTATAKSTRRPLIFGSLLLLGGAATTLSAVSWRDASAANR